jgi:hypothetical protein
LYLSPTWFVVPGLYSRWTGRRRKDVRMKASEMRRGVVHVVAGRTRIGADSDVIGAGACPPRLFFFLWFVSFCCYLEPLSKSFLPPTEPLQCSPSYMRWAPASYASSAPGDPLYGPLRTVRASISRIIRDWLSGHPGFFGPRAREIVE